MRRCLQAAVFALAGVLLFAASGNHSEPAEATFPGTNGKLAYTVDPIGPQGSDIWVINPSGISDTQVTFFGEFFNAAGPAWSSDGQRIAFVAKNLAVPNMSFIDIMDFPGPCNLPSPQDPPCNLRTVVNFPSHAEDVTWSPDGSKIAFSDSARIFSTDVQSGGWEQLTPEPEPGDDIRYTQPSWSPDGTKIAFTIRHIGPGTYNFQQDIGTVPAAGGAVTKVTNLPDDGCETGHPSWSPDGTKIVYETGICFRPYAWTIDFGSFPIQYTAPPDSAISIVDVSSRVSTPVTLPSPFGNGGQAGPVWSPNGARVAFLDPGCFPACNARTMNINGTDPQGLLLQPGARDLDWQALDSPLNPPTFTARGEVSSSFDTDVFVGENVVYEGHGWDPNGGPIQVLWGEEVVATVDATDDFSGQFPAKDYPRYNQYQLSQGEFGCKTNVTARQGEDEAAVEIKGKMGEHVRYARNVLYEDGTPVGPQDITCAGTFLYPPDGVATDKPLFSAPDDAGGPDLLADVVCNFSTAPFTLSTLPVEGRPLRDRSAVNGYGGFWIQHISDQGTCVDAHSVGAEMIFIGSELVGWTPPEPGAQELIKADGQIITRPGGPVSILADIVHFRPDPAPPGNADQDSIADEIDGVIQNGSFLAQNNGFSPYFTNQHLGGTVTGQIWDYGGITLRVRLAAADPNAVEVTGVKGGGSPLNKTGRVKICGEIVEITDGGAANFKCGSLIAEVTAGEIFVALGVSVLAQVPEGAQITVEEAQDGEYEVRNDAGSTTPIVLYAQGMDRMEIGPGESETVTPIAAGDVNCDGAANLRDALLILRGIAGLPAMQDCANASDVNCSGAVDAEDVLALVSHEGGLPVLAASGCPEIGEI